MSIYYIYQIHIRVPSGYDLKHFAERSDRIFTKYMWHTCSSTRYILHLQSHVKKNLFAHSFRIIIITLDLIF